MSADLASSEFVTWINGREYRHAAIDPEMTLLHYLRRHCNLTGSKLGCAEGGCGACTVAVSRYPGDLQPVNACLAPLASIHERHVITVEGLRCQDGKMSGIHKVQREMQTGSQCGFCTPGFVMSLYARWCEGNATVADIEDTFDGNLCRCTGYRPIIDAARRVLCPQGTSQDDGEQRKECMNQGSELEGRLHDSLAHADALFPPELKSRLDGRSLVVFRGPRVAWYRPVSLAQLLALKAEKPTIKPIFGNTEVGIETKFKNCRYPELVFLGDLPELDYIREDDQERVVEIGAGVNLARLKGYAHQQLENQSWAMAAHEILKWFAGNQVRAVSSWAGNLVTASPISDLNPLWIALNAQVLVTSQERGDRSVLANDFIQGYRRVDLRPDEVIRALRVPVRHPSQEFVQAYKQSKRRDDDIAIVNAACRVSLDEHNCVRECSLVFGGMGPITRRSIEATAACIGRKWGEDGFLAEILGVLEKEFALPPEAIGGMAEYRLSLVLSFFFKFYLYVCNHIGIELMDTVQSAIAERTGGELIGKQQYEPGPDGSIVGHPHMHLSGLKHATGEAIFVDDLPPLQGELYGAPVLSTIAHGRIKSIDMVEARSLAGVVDIITYRDVPATNKHGPVFQDEFIFVEEEVTSYGQLIALIIAQDHIVAQRAAKLVRITYEELPAILTIDVCLFR